MVVSLDFFQTWGLWALMGCMEKMSDFASVRAPEAMGCGTRCPTLDEMEGRERVGQDGGRMVLHGEEDGNQFTFSAAAGGLHTAAGDGCGLHIGVDGCCAAHSRDDGAVGEEGVVFGEGGVIGLEENGSMEGRFRVNGRPS